jgi:HSP20 family protein
MRALAPWKPMRELATLHHDIDEMLSRFFGEEGWLPTRWPAMTPAIESFIREGELVVRADLPGIDPKKVEVAVEGDHLVMRGEREEKTERTAAAECLGGAPEC